MPIAEILTIGTEILLGEIQDTNTAYLARAIKDLGIDLYRTQTVGDNPARITAILKEILARADIILTTGGLGPTVDDPTRQAVADAFDLPLVFSEECWDQVQAYFIRLNCQIPENNRRQAYIPAGATIIPNPVGTAPAFIVDTGEKVLISVPGVPKEMEHLVVHTIAPYLKQRWKENTVIRTRTIHTVGMGEAVLDDLIGAFEQWKNPTIGLLAKSGIVDIRIGAKTGSVEEAEVMIQETIDQIIPNLGRHVYGYDQTTLSQTVGKLADELGFPICIQMDGFGTSSVEMLAELSSASSRIISLKSYIHPTQQNQDVHTGYKFDAILDLKLSRWNFHAGYKL